VLEISKKESPNIKAKIKKRSIDFMTQKTSRDGCHQKNCFTVAYSSVNLSTYIHYFEMVNKKDASILSAASAHEKCRSLGYDTLPYMADSSGYYDTMSELWWKFGRQSNDTPFPIVVFYSMKNTGSKVKQ